MQGDPAAFLTSFAHKHSFRAGGGAWVASSHSTLLGHEDWVHSVAWAPQPPAARGGSEVGHSGAALPRLLSASMDRTMMVWERDAAGEIWMCVKAVGDAGALNMIHTQPGATLSPKSA